MTHSHITPTPPSNDTLKRFTPLPILAASSGSVTSHTVSLYPPPPRTLVPTSASLPVSLRIRDNMTAQYMAADWPPQYMYKWYLPWRSQSPVFCFVKGLMLTGSTGRIYKMTSSTSSCTLCFMPALSIMPDKTRQDKVTQQVRKHEYHIICVKTM